MNETETRQCKKCLKVKNAYSDFYGKRRICKRCRRTQINTWFAANPYKLKAYNISHYIRQKYKENRGRISEKDIRFILRIQANVCAACGVNFTAEPFTIDHIVPLMLGGLNKLANIQLLCGMCNNRKGLEPIDYRRKDKLHEDRS